MGEKSKIRADRLLVLLTGAGQQILDELKRDYRKNGLDKISPAMGAVLCALRRSQPRSMREIAHHIARDPSTVTPIVQKLLKLNLVIQKRSREDGREWLVLPTPQGDVIRAKVVRISRGIHVRLYRDLNVEERERLVSLLARLRS